MSDSIESVNCNLNYVKPSIDEKPKKGEVYELNYKTDILRAS